VIYVAWYFVNSFGDAIGNFPPEIESKTENYPELQVANLNYAGGHTGHQI
jgi:hypothetical protein